MQNRPGRVLSVLGFVAVVALSGCGRGGSSPGAVVERFLSLSNRGQTEQALGYVSPDSQWSVSSSMMWSGITSMVGVRFKGVTISEVEITDDEATVHYRLRYSASIYDSAGRAYLTKVDGRWLITDLTE